MNIIILTGHFGLGHFSTAQAIRQQLELEFEDVNAEVIDFIEYATDSELIYKAFNLLVRRGEKVFNMFYHLSEGKTGAIGVPMKGYCFRAFSRMLEEKKPDLIISTLPFTTQVAGQYKAAMTASGKMTDIPLVSCITDTAVHGDWIAPQVDAYMVPCAETREHLATYGIEQSRIFVSGIPVRPGFTPGPVKDQREERNLLLLGGGFGLMSGDIDFYAALDALPNVKTTIICGGNEKLRLLLDGRFSNIEVLGYVTDVETYMRRADLLVSKPGGVTLFETMACRLPILSCKPFLAQEMANAEFIDRHGLGWVMKEEPEQSVDLIRHMLWNDMALATARHNMDRQAKTVCTGTLGYLVRVLTADVMAA